MANNGLKPVYHSNSMSFDWRHLCLSTVNFGFITMSAKIWYTCTKLSQNLADAYPLWGYNLYNGPAENWLLPSRGSSLTGEGSARATSFYALLAGIVLFGFRAKPVGVVLVVGT